MQRESKGPPISKHGALPIQLTDQDAIAYIAESDPQSLAVGEPRFFGHIEGRLPPRLIEEGPGWPTAAAAIEWAGDRARIVLIRVGIPGTYYSAGIEDLPEDSPPRWPGSSVT